MKIPFFHAVSLFSLPLFLLSSPTFAQAEGRAEQHCEVCPVCIDQSEIVLSENKKGCYLGIIKRHLDPSTGFPAYMNFSSCHEGTKASQTLSIHFRKIPSKGEVDLDNKGKVSRQFTDSFVASRCLLENLKKKLTKKNEEKQS